MAPPSLHGVLPADRATNREDANPRIGCESAAVIPGVAHPCVRKRRSPSRPPFAHHGVGVYGPAWAGMTEYLPRLLNDRTLTV